MVEIDITIKLLLACAFGALIGYFREKEKKAAGLKTHILVCAGSALFTLISIHFSSLFPGSDAARIAANIVVGIGFIGAGTIIQTTPGSIAGITTAASIWIVAAIGMAAGVGYYFAATATTLISVLVLHFVHRFEIKYIRGEKD